MSPFLYHVSRLVSHSAWIDPYLFCSDVDNGRTVEFLATDDGWYGTLAAQHPLVLNDEQYARVDGLIRSVDFESAFFQVELHESLQVARGVLRFPIYNEPRWKDDARAVVRSFTADWTMISPFITAAADATDIRDVITQARATAQRSVVRH